RIWLFWPSGDRGSPGSLWSAQDHHDWRCARLACTVWSWCHWPVRSCLRTVATAWPVPNTGLPSWHSKPLILRCSTPIVADLFVGDARTVALIVFNLQVPLWAAVWATCVGGQVAQAADSCEISATGVVCVLLLLLQFREPACGQAEKSTHMHATSWRDDVRHLLRNRSFMLNTLGFTAVAFVAGALTWWTPLMLDLDLQFARRPSLNPTKPPWASA
uniref:MMPL domain-containing protein n=1 Tax=Macrostomum lignano TaxID=282301 RepID=A0A1I8F376_9PLAT